MRVEFLGKSGTWREIADSARTTIGMDSGEGEPSSEWKRRMLLCEHSPIRKLSISAKWTNLKSWVSVHLVRHKFGIEHWVRSQRTDRTGIDREQLTQSELIEHEIQANAQAIINISRKRLCFQASPETRDSWIAFLNSFKDSEPELNHACQPDCIYRGYCYEYKSCNFHKTEEFKSQLEAYRKGINGN